MRRRIFKSVGLVLLASSLKVCLAATFGTVVPIHGTVSDIALDERRGRVYAANFGAYRVEVVDTNSKTLLAPISVPMPPSAVAISPDNRFLVIGQYLKPDPAELSTQPFAESGGYTIIDLDANQRVEVNLNNPVLAVAFGADGRALILTRQPKLTDSDGGAVTNLFLLDPATQFLQPIQAIQARSLDLGVPLAKVPTQIVQAASGVSGDKKFIWILASAEEDASASAQTNLVIRYDVSAQAAFAGVGTSSPAAGPRSVGVDQTGGTAVLDWAMERFTQDRIYIPAQFPRPNGAFNVGTHAWDHSRNVMYSQIPADGDASVLHILDTDNLTVRQRIRLRENLSGKSVMSSDYSTMYSASVSGVTILPIAQLPQAQQVGATQEDLLFSSDLCANLGVQQTLNITSLGTARTDFKLSLPSGVTGITFSRISGTTPAQVVLTIDPSAFQGANGTTSIPLTITSEGSVNLPPPVRLLINTRDFHQRGQVFNVPGKIVDMLADPVRKRVYLLRQDKNLVLVYETTTPPRLIATLRTGNTPTGMAITTDNLYLIVGNDNSQIANVYDLEGVKQLDPIIVPGGHYPRTIGIVNGAIFALSRLATELPVCTPAISGTAALDHIDFGNRTAYTPCTLSAGAERSIFQNGLPTADGVFATSPGNGYMMLALADGNVLQYDASAATWVASRKDLTSVKGAYGAFSGNLFLVGNTFLDAALVPTGQPLDDGKATSTGVGLLSGAGLWATSTGAANPGILQRIDLNSLTPYNATAIAESTVTKDALLTPQIGQIGQSILSFTRALAVSNDQRQIFALTTSGLTILPPNFDAVLNKPVITNVTNSADGSPALAVGGDINIGGLYLAPGPASAGAPPLPTSLNQVCAVLDGTPLPLFSVSPPLLVAQLPFLATAGSTLVVHTSGGVSDPFQLNVAAQAPAIFNAIRDDNGEPLNFTNPIHPGTEITIYLTGLGLTSPLPPLGDVPPSGVSARVTGNVTVKLGSIGMFVTSVTLTPNQVGVYQIKATAPGKLTPGRDVPLTVQAGTVTASYSVRVVTP